MASASSTTASNMRLSLKQWSEIERLYAEGQVTLQELSAQFATPVRTIQAHLNKAGVKKGANLTGPSASAETDVSEASFLDEETAYQAEARKIALLIAEHVRAGLEKLAPGPSHANHLLKLTSAANKMNQFAKDLGIVLEPEESLPVLRVMEITAEQIQEMRELQRQEDEELCPHLNLDRMLEDAQVAGEFESAEQDDDDRIISETEIDGPCCLFEEDF